MGSLTSWPANTFLAKEKRPHQLLQASIFHLDILCRFSKKIDVEGFPIARKQEQHVFTRHQITEKGVQVHIIAASNSQWLNNKLMCQIHYIHILMYPCSDTSFEGHHLLDQMYPYKITAQSSGAPNLSCSPCDVMRQLEPMVVVLHYCQSMFLEIIIEGVDH